jgi:hypothetical protein
MPSCSVSRRIALDASSSRCFLAARMGSFQIAAAFSCGERFYGKLCNEGGFFFTEQYLKDFKKQPRRRSPLGEPVQPGGKWRIGFIQDDAVAWVFLLEQL